MISPRMPLSSLPFSVAGMLSRANANEREFTPTPAIRRGYCECGCGARISANKRFKWECAKREAEKAGLLK